MWFVNRPILPRMCQTSPTLNEQLHSPIACIGVHLQSQSGLSPALTQLAILIRDWDRRVSLQCPSSSVQSNLALPPRHKYLFKELVC